MELKYIFNFNETLVIEAIINQKTTWIEGETWGDSFDGDKIIRKRTKKKISYEISTDIEIFDDERLYSHPMVRKKYACFSANIGLFFPSIDENEKIELVLQTNFPLFVSGIGMITKEHRNTTTLKTLRRQLFVFTEKYITTPNITVTYYHGNVFFIKPKNIAKHIETFLRRCYNFFDIHENLHFLINYVDMIPKNNMEGYGGNGNFAGFNYSISVNKLTKSDKRNIIIYLSHELFHHFNRLTVSDYKSNWFSEGFTEFFCRFIFMKATEFKEECNKFILEYNLNPYKNASIDIMTKQNFWTNKFIEKLPYVKGFVYALYLYQQYGEEFIKKYIEIIRAIKNEGFITTNDNLRKKIGDINFHEYVIRGKTIKIKTNKTIIRKKPMIEFYLENAIKNKKIIRLNKLSYAYSIGIREGYIEKITINENKHEIIVKQDHKEFKLNILIGKKTKINIL